VFFLYEGLWVNSKAKVTVASAKPNMELCSESLIYHCSHISDDYRRRRVEVEAFLHLDSVAVSKHACCRF
jgi:hypothetical protein